MVLGNWSKLSSLVVVSDLLLQVVVLWVTSDLISREEGLCPVLEIIHETLSLEVRIEAHRRADFFVLLARSHLPDHPLRVRGLAVEIAVLGHCGDNTIVIDAWSTEIHPGWAQHFGGVTHLLEAFAVVV